MKPQTKAFLYLAILTLLEVILRKGLLIQFIPSPLPQNINLLLMFSAFDIPVKIRHARLYTDDFATLLSDFAPARSVPALKVDDSFVLWDSLAIAEFLSERHPGLWPDDPAARAFARSMVGEMHSGFGALRDYCPMNMRVAYSDCQAPDAVLEDVARIEHLWTQARSRFASEGPWLFGAYSLADVFFAPVAARFAGYALGETQVGRDYVATQLNDIRFRQWRAMGFAENYEQKVYRRDYPRTDWPGPEPIAANHTERRDSENKVCPYSGKPVSDFLEIDGRVFGFCNPFCRDKTLADPLAWPGFQELYEQ